MILILPLEPTDDLANPAFKNASSCVLWLRQLQLTNLPSAHAQLLHQLNELNRFPMRNVDRLNTLETLRETVAHVQLSYAAKLIAMPLPLSKVEFQALEAIIQLWKSLSAGYQRCLQGHLSGDPDLVTHVALLCQRCMLYSGMAIFEHLRAGYEFDGLLWQHLHKLYEFSEAGGFTRQDVPDPLLDNHLRSSCHQIYVKTLLACYARPAQLSRVQLQLLDDWLTEWCDSISIEHHYVSLKVNAKPLATDLASTHGLRPILQVPHSTTARYLAMTPLSKLLRVNIVLLEQGNSPQQLKLGINNSKDCIKFLTFLHQCWCEDLNTRFSDRIPNANEAKMCYPAEHIYWAVSGEPFKQPMRKSVSGSLALKQRDILGEAMTRDSQHFSSGKQLILETWLLENESILGAQLTRQASQGERLGFNQLIAIRLTGEDQFSLGATAWVNVLRTGQLRMGIRYFPGEVACISIRATQTDLSTSSDFVAAFMLEAIPKLKIPPSLVIPRNWFLSGRIIQVALQQGALQQAKLGFIVERGIDYERTSFNFI